MAPVMVALVAVRAPALVTMNAPELMLMPVLFSPVICPPVMVRFEADTAPALLTWKGAEEGVAWPMDRFPAASTLRMVLPVPMSIVLAVMAPDTAKVEPFHVKALVPLPLK